MGNARVREVASDLIKNLREFIHQHHITHPEYCQVVDFLQETAKQSEIPLLMDVFFESTVIDVTYQGEEGNREYSRGSVLRSRITHA
jgi:Catechol dioxygenase N terminus